MRRLIAQRAFAAGEQILEVHGVLVSTPSRYTIQVGQSEHVAPSNDPVADQPNLDPWCYLNHSCDPNARLIGRKLVAIRSIQTTEELTFDYNSNEYEMAEPFICRCAACGGSEIRGYRFLSPPKQQELRPHLAEHLLRSGRGDGVV